MQIFFFWKDQMLSFPLGFHTEHKNYQQHVKKGTIFVKINRFHAKWEINI